MPTAQDISRHYALEASMHRLIRGISTLAELQAELTANFDAATAAEFTASAAVVVATPPSLTAQTGKTAVLSLLAAASFAIDIPIAAAKRGLVSFSAFVQTARTGSATGTLQYKVGTNAAHDNMVALTNVGAAAFNATTFGMPFALVGPAGGGMPLMDAAPVLEIVTPLAGASVLQGRFGFQALYV